MSYILHIGIVLFGSFWIFLWVSLKLDAFGNFSLRTLGSFGSDFDRGACGRGPTNQHIHDIEQSFWSWLMTFFPGSWRQWDKTFQGLCNHFDWEWCTALHQVWPMAADADTTGAPQVVLSMRWIILGFWCLDLPCSGSLDMSGIWQKACHWVFTFAQGWKHWL